MHSISKAMHLNPGNGWTPSEGKMAAFYYF